MNEKFIVVDGNYSSMLTKQGTTTLM